MEVLPAIDILAGRCARLAQGDYERPTDYGEPADAARRFADAGARRLHVVDLDGARDGKIQNQSALKKIAEVCEKKSVRFQVGGGIRNLQAARDAIHLGAARVVLGTAALRDPAFREAAIAEFPGKIILGVDARDGEIALQGWRENSGVKIESFLSELRANPPAAVLHTDIACDGVMSGVNLSQTRAVSESAPCPVIASGGVSSAADLAALSQIPNLSGAIVGRAFYNGALNPADILRQFARAKSDDESGAE